MSAHVIVPRKEECPGDTIRWISKKPVLVSSRSDLVCHRKDDGLLGALGILVVAVILGLGVYGVVKYLL